MGNRFRYPQDFSLTPIPKPVKREVQWDGHGNITYLSDLVDPLKGRLVEFFWFVEEGGMSTMSPRVEFDVLEVAVHELVQFVTKDVLVHGAVKDQERKGIFDGE